MKLLPKAKSALLESIANRELKVALYSDRVSRPAYTPVGEIVGDGYEAGGKECPPLEVSGSDLVCDDAIVWDNSSIEASSVLIYDAKTGEGVFFEAFNKPIKSVRDAFTVMFPDVLFSLTER